MALTRNNLLDLSLKALANGKALVEEADILFKHQRFARTVFLCHTAGEEFGKCIACMSAAVDSARGVLNEKKFLKRFFDHTKKLTTIDLFETVMLNDVDGIEEKLKPIDATAKLWFDHRNVCLYATFFSDAVVAPMEAVDESLATFFLKLGKDRVGFMERYVEPLISSAAIRTVSDDVVRTRFAEFMELVRDKNKREKLLKEVSESESRS